MTLKFVCRGQVVTADGLPMVLSDHRPKVRPHRATEPSHHGFIVEGYRPDQVAEAKRVADEDVARWAAMTDEVRRRAIREGRREPKPWDEEAWLRKNKPKRVGRAYSMPDAAEVAMDLARKAGWTHLGVRALTRGVMEAA